ncbi:MAG: FGGY family carbohydrate kinase, partial [Elusimicrobiota bacterium]
MQTKMQPTLKTYLLGVDQGSSATKGILLDPETGRILAKARARIATRRWQKGSSLFVEHNPEEILQSVQTVLKKLLRHAPRSAALRLGIASQRSSFLLIDPADGRALTPVISWQDTRGLGLVEKLKPHAPRVHRTTGLYLTPYYTLSKLLWLLEKSPSLKARAARGKVKLAFIPTYLAARLTKEGQFAADPTLAQRSLLINLRTAQWDSGLIDAFGLPKTLLPKILDTSANYGTISLNGYAIKISAMIGDQQAAYLALQAGRPGKRALMNLGTGGFLLLGAGAEPRRYPGLLTGIAWRRKGRSEYLAEGTVTSISGVLKWLEGLGILKTSDRFEMPRPQDFKRLPHVTGSFGGLASPFWRGDLKVRLDGLDHTTTREQILGAFLLGLGHLFWEILKPLKSARPKKIIVSGGLSKSRGLLEILANYLDAVLEPVEDADLSALG